MTGTAIVLQGNALALPLPDESVDLIVTSPPYFALRSYQDGGEHYAGQIGSEPTPKDFVDALVTAMREAVRVLKPTGSIFVNLGDKYAGSGGHNNATLQAPRTGEFGTRRREKAKATRRTAPDHYNKSREVAEGVNVARKSLLGLPWRFALACTDELGLILREEIVWSKPNGLPESVRDRCRRTHEQWFHFAKAERYFAAIDEIRAPHAHATVTRAQPHRATTKTNEDTNTIGPEQMMNPKGALPPSVWTIATEPLTLPALAIEDDRGWRMFGRPARTEADARKARADLWEYAERRHAEGCESLHVFEPDHFAVFPTEWPRRLILGFAPSGVCTVCGEGRVPAVVADPGTRERQMPPYGAGRHGKDGSTLGHRGRSATVVETTSWTRGSSCRAIRSSKAKMRRRMSRDRGLGSWHASSSIRYGLSASPKTTWGPGRSGSHARGSEATRSDSSGTASTRCWSRD